jgi:nucleoside-diphosphate-sugar epimerase
VDTANHLSDVSDQKQPIHALLTGASGMLGQHTAEVLLEAGARIYAFVRTQSDVAHLRRDGVALVHGDAAKGVTETVRRAMDEVDVVIHLAGYLTVGAPFGGADASPLYETINVSFTEQLLKAALEAGVSRFVFASSNSVYAPDAPVPTPEDAPLAPSSPYGRSKLEAEGLVQAYGARGLQTTIIRPAVIYGPGDRHFTPTALRLARLPLLPLVNGGETLFDMVYARDVARLLWRAAHREEAAGRIYNAGPGRPTTLRQLAEIYGRLTGRGPRIVSVSEGFARRFAVLGRPFLARRAPGAEAALTPEGLALMTQDLHLDMRRAEEELGYKPRISLEEGLRRTLAALNQT